MDAVKYYQEYWSRDSAIPDEDATTPMRIALLLSALRGIGAPGGGRVRVLDAGCGSGGFSGVLTARGHKVCGIDISPSAIEKARRRAPQSKFEVCSLESRLPFEDEAFDAVWSTEVIEHLFQPDFFLKEACRILRPGGRIILTTPYHGFWKNIAVSAAGFDRHFDPKGPHIRFFSPASLRAMLEDSGFSRVSWEGIGRLWPLYKAMFVMAEKA